LRNPRGHTRSTSTCGDLDHPVIDGDRQQAAWRQLPVYRRGETVDWASCSRQGSDLGPY
jgi:hypothetical protein